MTARLLVRGRASSGATGRPAGRDGVVTQVGSVSSGDGVEVLDADGLVALPGFVDLHPPA